MRHGSRLEQLPLGEGAQLKAVDQARQALGSIILGKDPEISLALAWLCPQRSPADRGPARIGQDHTGAVACQRPWPELPAHSVHQ